MMGFELFKGSAEKIFQPEAVSFSWLSIGILLLSIAVKGWMCLFNRKLGRMIGSTAMQATAMDSLSDVAATTGRAAGYSHHRGNWRAAGWVFGRTGGAASHVYRL